MSNQARGGEWTEWPELPAPIAELAVAAARAVGAEQAGVDLIQDKTGDWFVLECNDMAELGPASVQALVDYLVREARREREG